MRTTVELPKKTQKKFCLQLATIVPNFEFKSARPPDLTIMQSYDLFESHGIFEKGNKYASITGYRVTFENKLSKVT